MVKLRHHEFWNTHIFHLPVYLYWLYLSLKARSFFFFSAANPGIENGGLIGESKFRILSKIDKAFIPRMLYYPKAPDIGVAVNDLIAARIEYPFVAKPDIGQGGWMVEKIEDEHDLKRFLHKIKMPFIIQEFVDKPIELGVLYYRHPESRKGVITSVAAKELLTVTGDGKRTILELLRQIPRARKQTQRLIKAQRLDLGRVPAKEEIVQLSFVGNHSYGTTFRNWNHIIDSTLTESFDRLCRNIDGFYFGRFDLRCNSIDDLKNGNFTILELNGVGSEPLHVFDPGEKILDAWKSSFFHWKKIFEISMKNRAKVRSFMNLAQAWETYKNVLRIQRIHQTNLTIGN
jgi:hypothetical protein